MQTGQIDWKTEGSRVGGTRDTLRSATTGLYNRSDESECDIRSRTAAADRSEKGGTRSKKQEQFLQLLYEVPVPAPRAASCIRGGASLPYILLSVFRLSRTINSWRGASECSPDCDRFPWLQIWPEGSAASASVPAGTGDPVVLLHLILQTSRRRGRRGPPV